jgi:hypothetical protein
LGDVDEWGGLDLMQFLQEPEYLPYLVAIFCRSAHEFLVGGFGCCCYHRLIAERDDGDDYITFHVLAASLLEDVEGVMCKGRDAA